MVKQLSKGETDRQLAAVRVEYLTLEESGAPKSACLAQALLRVLESGQWSPGDRLPTEALLADALPVSLGTVQSALRELVNSGSITRKRRDGTRFAEVLDPHTRNVHIRFYNEQLGRFLISHGRILKISETTKKGPWRDFLNPKGACLKITRELDMEGHFTIENVFYLEAERFSGLADLPVEEWEDDNLRHLLHERFNVPTLRATQSLKFRTAKRRKKTTKDAVDATVMELAVHAFTLRDKPLFFQRFLIPPNDFPLRLIDWKPHILST